jgi:septum formation protein
VPHVVVAANADEAVRPGEDADTYLARVARAKLAAVLAILPRDVAERAPAVLVADTSVVVDAEVLGKPADVDEAERMVARLAGRTHEVKTRFAVAWSGPRRTGDEVAHEETVTTRVTFRSLTPREVRAYAESGEGLDKAGAYAVQGLGAAIVSRVCGSYTNVVGLPACEVVVALSRLGIVRW